MDNLRSWHPLVLDWFKYINQIPDDFAHAKRLYRRAALVLHPDKPTGDEAKFRELFASLEDMQKLFSHGTAKSFFDLYKLVYAEAGRSKPTFTLPPHPRIR